MSSPVVAAARVLLGMACAAVAWAAPAPAPASAPAPAPASAALSGRHFLWEVSSLTNRVYLFGTIHAGKAGWYPMAREIEDALVRSDVLVVEADVTDAAAMAKSSDAMSYDAPDKLSNHVPAPDYERFRKLLGRYSVDEPLVASLKPFAAVSLLVFGEWARLGYLPDLGMDAYLLRRAKAEKKRIVEIEGVEAQAQLMDSLTEDEQRVAFAGTLTALESGLTEQQISDMVRAWQAGDAGKMLEVARRYNDAVPGARALEEKFVWSRHGAMLDKIEGYLKSRERHFVAVGSLHLAGPLGLVEQLRARGYLVKQK